MKRPCESRSWSSLLPERDELLLRRDEDRESSSSSDVKRPCESRSWSSLPDERDEPRDELPALRLPEPPRPLLPEPDELLPELPVVLLLEPDEELPDLDELPEEEEDLLLLPVEDSSLSPPEPLLPVSEEDFLPPGLDEDLPEPDLLLELVPDEPLLVDVFFFITFSFMVRHISEQKQYLNPFNLITANKWE